MFFRDPNAPPPQRVTCSECGLEYADDSDWSGPAHGERECRQHLQNRLAEVISERNELASRGHHHGEPCYFCKEPINSLAANPGRWGVPLCHEDDPATRPRCLLSVWNDS